MDDKEMASQNVNSSPTRDLESGRLQVLKRSPSRASLPQSRDGDQGAHTDDGDDFEWGPSHPCFPHLNPHVPLNSQLYQSTRIIRIKRDWMQVGDLAPTFNNLYPEILDPNISEVQFRQIVEYINRELITAFNPYGARNFVDTVLSVATFWLWEDLGFVAIKQRLEKLETWIADWNRDVGMRDGVSIIPLRRTGYLTLDIQIPDPQIGIDPSLVSRPHTSISDRPRDIGDVGPYPITISPGLPQTQPAGIAV